MYTSLTQLSDDLSQVYQKTDSTPWVTNPKLLSEKIIDNLIYTAVFTSDNTLKKETRVAIRDLATAFGIIPSSIHFFYAAIGSGKVKPDFTVPAINIRTLTYDTARTVFRLMNTYNIGTVIFEIARSEIQYTDQRPDEYVGAVLAAAIKEGYRGPVYIQADHCQLSKNKFAQNPDEEINNIKSLVKESIEAGFYNIDIDASTLVDLSKPTQDEQQKTNYEVTAQLTEYIRSLEPKNTTISIGGEIGHIGGKNSTTLEFEAFMNGYLKLLNGSTGISKVSVQTGTTHGGVPLPDGKIADVKLDFEVLKLISKVARTKYHIGGSVQHGASTLPNELFSKFPQNSTLEIHLATGFQNIVYETIPSSLRNQMHAWVKQNLQKEKEDAWNEEQFIYKTRKKALGPFKQKLWNLSENEKQPIIQKLEDQFAFLFEQLNIKNTKKLVENYIQ